MKNASAKFKVLVGGGLILLMVALSPFVVLAQTNVVTFDGLATAVRNCTSSAGIFTIGEDVSTQIQSLGIVFSVNQFAIAYGTSTAIAGGTGTSGNPILAVNTVDNAANRCPVGRTGDNGVLTATFVDVLSGNPSTVANVRIHVADTEASVHVRTFDKVGAVIHECSNIFAGCPFIVASTSISVDLLFPGEGIAKVEFIDEDSAGRADGFTLDDLAFDLTPQVREVSIDIKPGSFPNSINPNNSGKTPVAILTTDTFDASTVDPTRVLFGQTGTETVPMHSALEDVDGDGDIDMILHFHTQQTGIQCGDTSAVLTAATFRGQAIRGSDLIKTAGCK